MEHMDEKILKAKREMEEIEKQRFSKKTIDKENEQSIFSGEVKINAVPVKFSERKLYDERISIWMPTDFEELTSEEISAVYLLGNKPDCVYGNTHLNLSVGFHYTEHVVPNEMMGEFAKVVQVMLERSGPKVKIYASKVITVGEHSVSYLEFMSHTLEAAIYNLLFFSSLEEKVLIGFMNFGEKHIKRYKSIVHEILESFHFAGDEEVEK